MTHGDTTSPAEPGTGADAATDHGPETLETTTGDTTSHLGRRPGLDAVRGLAVAGILLFHSAPDWFSGGFLSVDVFFVLSGFLITTLVLGEVDSTGKLSLRGFWTRRAKRLVPALVVVAAAVVVAAYAGAYRGAPIGRDVIGAFTWSSNWVQSGGDYFAQVEAPSPMENFWSLAIEEQFYLVFPLVVLAITWKTRHVRRALGLIAVAGIIASTWQAVNLSGQGAGINRLYMGTDTRAVALFVGVALAAVTFKRWTLGARAGRVLIAAAGIILVGATAALVAGWAPTVDTLANGGWLVVAALSAVVVYAACQPSVGNTAGTNRALMWLGSRSYALYLWHLPILLLAGRTAGWWTAVALMLTGTAAEVSYRLVETPVQRRSRARLNYIALAEITVAALLIVPALPVDDASTGARLAQESARHTDTPPTVAGAHQAPAAVLVWGDDTANRTADLLARDNRLEVTRDVHQECQAVASCVGLAPTVSGDVDMVVIAASGPEAYGTAITNTMDPTEPERLARDVWNQWSQAVGDTPVALAAPPGERIDLGPSLHLRHLLGQDASNLVLGTDTTTWARDIASRVTDTSDRTLLLVGDSVAWSLAATFAPDGYTVWDRSLHGCNTAPGDLVTERGGHDQSPPVCDWRHNWTDEVNSFDPDLVVVHVGVWESYDRWINGDTAPVGSPTWADAQQAQFEQVIDTAGQRGAHVVLFIQAPAWQTEAGTPAETRPGESAWRMKAVLETAQAAAVGQDDVTVLDATAVVCTHATCDHSDIREDGVHYTEQGARQVSTWLAGKLDDIDTSAAHP
jgi:peptidoglycan/LPS O-acetylase OafA/YrhL